MQREHRVGLKRTYTKESNVLFTYVGSARSQGMARVVIVFVLVAAFP